MMSKGATSLSSYESSYMQRYNPPVNSLPEQLIWDGERRHIELGAKRSRYFSSRSDRLEKRATSKNKRCRSDLSMNSIREVLMMRVQVQQT